MAEVRDLAWHEQRLEIRWPAGALRALMGMHLLDTDRSRLMLWALGDRDPTDPPDTLKTIIERQYDAAHLSLVRENPDDRAREAIFEMLRDEFFPPKPESVE